MLRFLTLVCLVVVGCQHADKNSHTNMLPGNHTGGAENRLNPRTPEDIEVFFHPYESTFAPIADLFRNESYKRIDIAMYSMEPSAERSEIIKAIKEQSARLESGDLKIRMIFQGYSDPCEKCPLFEQMGIDVRQIGSKDVHHKFGVFYGGDQSAIMTGSGNWSNSSNTMYDENMLLIRNHQGTSQRYIEEFQRLWGYHAQKRELSEDEQSRNQDDDPTNDVWDNWGEDLGHEDLLLDQMVDVEPGVEVVFNSANFKITPSSARTISPKKFVLTNRLVKLIDSAKETIHMATPRISLRPVYDALLRAADRGVKITIMTTEAEYQHPSSRNRDLIGKLFGCDIEKLKDESGQIVSSRLKNSYGRCCRKHSGTYVFDPYVEKCSTSQNHIKLLHEGNFPGAGNIDFRLKLFTWFPRSQSISKQMHAKFTIVDKRHVMAGSFNYSFNSEYKLFENVILLDGQRYPQTVDAMLAKFERMYNRGRATYVSFQEEFEQAHKNKTKIDCPELMFSLSYEEITHFLETRARHKKHPSLKAACND